MTNLEKLINDYCPNGVVYGTLSEIGKACMCKRIMKNETSSTGDIPFYKIGTFGKVPDAYISKEKFNEYRKKYSYPKVGDILVSCSGTIGKTVIFDGHDSYYQDSNIVWLDNDESKILNKFLYYIYQTCPWKIESGGTIKRLYTNNFLSAKIPIPPISIQKEIISILDKFCELEAELEARRSQYEFWRDKIFEFKDRTDVKWLKLKEIATDIYRGNGIKKDEVLENGVPCVRYGEIYTQYNIWFDKCVSYTSKNVVSNPKIFEHNDLLFAITGESVEDISKTIAYLGEEKCYAGGDIVVLKHNQNAKYLSYALSTTNSIVQKGKGKTKTKVVHSSVPSIQEIVVPIVSLDEQEKIVNILDKFYELTSSFEYGIPAEIELRRQQYEYYRDKLLSFKELENE